MTVLRDCFALLRPITTASSLDPQNSGGGQMKSGGPKKNFFRRFAPEFVPPTYNLLPTPLHH